MGRSVLTHPDAVVTATAYWQENHISICTHCDSEVKREWNGEMVWVPEATDMKVEYDNKPWLCPDNPEEDGEHEGHDYDSDNFTNDLEWFTEWMKEKYPSLWTTDRWVGNEIHVVLENNLVEVSVSEYCGIVALCIAPLRHLDEYNPNFTGLATNWINRISDDFTTTFGGR